MDRPCTSKYARLPLQSSFEDGCICFSERFVYRNQTASRPCLASPGKEYKEARVDSKIENEIKKYISENSREEVRENLELNFSKTKYLMKEGLGRFSK